MEAESYADAVTAEEINANFVPATVNIKGGSAEFQRFSALWTPTVLVMDPNGLERFRNEGYLPNLEFRAWLAMGAARVVFMHKRWEQAQQMYEAIIERYGGTTFAAEAVYWRGVCRFEQTHDHVPLDEMAEDLNARYRDTVWAKKTSLWLPVSSVVTV